MVKNGFNANTDIIIIISWSARAAWVPLDHKQGQIQKKNALGILLVAHGNGQSVGSAKKRSWTPYTHSIP